MHGRYKPNKENYSIPAIKDKTFTGYQTLAYYYTSWAIAMPDQVAQLQLPFDNEFALAKQIIQLQCCHSKQHGIANFYQENHKAIITIHQKKKVRIIRVLMVFSNISLTFLNYLAVN
jgi:hypothetical protein